MTTIPTDLRPLLERALEGSLAERVVAAKKIRALLAADPPASVQVEAPKVVATAILGGLFHGGSGPEFGDIDIEVCMPAFERLQVELISSTDDVHVGLMPIPQHERIVYGLHSKLADPEFPPKYARRLIAELRQQLAERDAPHADLDAIKANSAPVAWVQQLPVRQHAPCKPDADLDNEYCIPLYAASQQPSPARVVMPNLKVMRQAADVIFNRVDKAASEYEAGRSASGLMEDIAERALYLRNALDDVTRLNAPRGVALSKPSAQAEVVSVPRELLANFIEYSSIHKHGVESLWDANKQKLCALLSARQDDGEIKGHE